MRLDPQTLAQFSAVAREKSFTRAAASLHIAQPWLSTRIRKLEDQLGFALFTRNTRSIELTQEGQALREAADQIATWLDVAQQTAEQLKRSHVEEVRIGSAPCGHKISIRQTLMQDFRIKHDRANFELDIGWSPKLIKRVLSNELDLAFVLTTEHLPVLDYVDLEAIGIQLLVPRSDQLAERSEIDVHMLAGRHVAVFTRSINPEVYDRLFTPLSDAGAKLIQMAEFEREIALAEANNKIIFARYTTTDEHMGEHLARCTVKGGGTVAFSLVKRRVNTNPLAEILWSLAKDYS